MGLVFWMTIVGDSLTEGEGEIEWERNGGERESERGTEQREKGTEREQERETKRLLLLLSDWRERKEREREDRGRRWAGGNREI